MLPFKLLRLGYSGSKGVVKYAVHLQILRILTLIIAFGLAWACTTGSFYWGTNEGNLYQSSSTVDSDGYRQHYVGINDNTEYYTRQIVDGVYMADVFIQQQLIMSLNIGNVEKLQKQLNATAINPIQCSTSSPNNLAIAWQFSGTLYTQLMQKNAQGHSQGCTDVIRFSEAWKALPFSHDLEINIPRGTLEPFLTQLISQATQARKEKLKPELVKPVTLALNNDIWGYLQLDQNMPALKKIAFRYGTFQFVSLLFMYASIILVLISLVKSWARDLSEATAAIIPYIGFLGTLLGMGAGLSILGEANLSDSLSKSVNLGPIGSQLGLAIETTKYAIVCFAVSALTLAVRDTIKGR